MIVYPKKMLNNLNTLLPEIFLTLSLGYVFTLYFSETFLYINLEQYSQRLRFEGFMLLELNFVNNLTFTI